MTCKTRSITIVGDKVVAILDDFSDFSDYSSIYMTTYTFQTCWNNQVKLGGSIAKILNQPEAQHRLRRNHHQDIDPTSKSRDAQFVEGFEAVKNSAQGDEAEAIGPEIILVAEAKVPSIPCKAESVY